MQELFSIFNPKGPGKQSEQTSTLCIREDFCTSPWAPVME